MTPTKEQKELLEKKAHEKFPDDDLVFIGFQEYDNKKDESDFFHYHKILCLFNVGKNTFATEIDV